MKLRKMPDKISASNLPGKPDPDELNRIIMEEASHAGIFDNIDTDSDWKIVRRRIRNEGGLNKTTPLYVYFLRIAALVIFTTGLTYGFYRLIILNKDSGSGFTTFASDEHKKEIILPDGSHVTLNAGSTLSYQNGFGTGSRDVILNGEAYFNVIPGLDSPFRVFSDGTVVKVTGTSFSVYKENGTVHVAVITGKVQLSSTANSSRSIIIAANQSGFLTETNESKVEEGIPDNVLSWKTGHLSFDQTSIDTALIDIARHFNRDLTIETSIHERITAEFQDQPLSEILEEISLVAGLQFDTTGTALIVRK